MRLYVALGAGSVAVLGGALALSSYLTSEVEPPPSTPLPAPVVAARAATPTPVPDTPRAPEPVAVAAPLAPAQAPSSPTPAPPPANAASAPVAVEAAPEPAPDEHPFAAEYSRELNYAESLLNRRDAGVTEVTSAKEVFERCLAQNPANEQCQRGLQAAKARYLDVSGAPRQPIRSMPRLSGQRFTNPLLVPETDRVPAGKKAPPPPRGP